MQLTTQTKLDVLDSMSFNESAFRHVVWLSGMLDDGHTSEIPATLDPKGHLSCPKTPQPAFNAPLLRETGRRGASGTWATTASPGSSTSPSSSATRPQLRTPSCHRVDRSPVFRRSLRHCGCLRMLGFGGVSASGPRSPGPERGPRTSSPSG